MNRLTYIVNTKANGKNAMMRLITVSSVLAKLLVLSSKIIGVPR